MENLRRSPQPAARPTQSPEPAQPGPEPTPPRNTAPKANKKKPQKRLVVMVAAFVAVVVLVLAGWFAWNQSSSALIDSGKYQAVFLTNGQVYFGKLDRVGSDYYKLNKIFYLQATEQAGGNPQEAGDENDAGDVQLIKLGTEVHGPTDEMVIGSEQVLFYENLKEDGNVVKSINQYYESNKDN